MAYMASLLVNPQRILGLRGVSFVVCALAIMLMTACQSTQSNGDLASGSSGFNGDGSAPASEEIALTTEREGGHISAAQQFMKLFNEDGEVKHLIGAARNLRYHGSSKDALAVLIQYQDEFENDPNYRLELGKTRIAAGKEKEAIADLEFAADGLPFEWAPYSALGIAHDLNENFEAAHEAYTRAIELSDEDPAVLNNFAISKALSGDIKGAIALLQDHPRAIRRSAHIRQNLAMFMAINGDDQTASELARMDLDDEQAQRNIEFFKQFRKN